VSARAVAFALLAAIAVAACGVGPLGSRIEQDQCTTGRLDVVPDPAALFANADVPCVIVTWDTDMEGAGVGPDGGIQTPPALVAAATSNGFETPCETTVDPLESSPSRAWFLERFGALSPTALQWGVTLFVPGPLGDGVNPWCSIVSFSP
jgi:hypothetical protein